MQRREGFLQPRRMTGAALRAAARAGELPGARRGVRAVTAALLDIETLRAANLDSHAPWQPPDAAGERPVARDAGVTR